MAITWEKLYYQSTGNSRFRSTGNSDINVKWVQSTGKGDFNVKWLSPVSWWF